MGNPLVEYCPYGYYEVMNIELIACAIEESTLSFPMGALCIKAAINNDPLLSETGNCELFAYTLHDDPAAAAADCATRESDVVGLSVYLWNRQWMDTFAKTLHNLSPKTILFAGGTEVTANSHSMANGPFNFLVLGEGEQSVVRSLHQILANEPIEGPGVQTPEHPDTSASFPQDLGTLPSPFLSGAVDLSEIPCDGVLWEMTRGCPFHCAFCFESKGERSVRQFPFERIEKELKWLVDHDVCNVFVLDPTFNMDKQRTVKILTFLVKHAPQQMHFTFELRAELLDAQTADLFAQLYCSLQIGLQSRHPQVLEAINRRFDPEVFAQKVKLLDERGIAYGLDLIIGLPNDSYDLFRQSLDYAISLRPSNIDIFPLALLPGTVVAAQAGQLGIKHMEESPYLVISTPTYSEADLAKAMRLKEACDLFYTKGQASMWIHTACSGLGITSTNLLDLFSSWIEFRTSKYPDTPEQDIYVLQEEFLRTVYTKTGHADLFAALRSYMELHQGFCYLHDTGEAPVVHLDYTPDELSLLDTHSLAQFVKRHKPIPGGTDLAIFEDEEGQTLFVPASEE